MLPHNASASTYTNSQHDKTHEKKKRKKIDDYKSVDFRNVPNFPQMKIRYVPHKKGYSGGL